MSECVILYRIGDGKPQFVATEDGKMATFPHLDNAVAYTDRNALFASGQATYQIVELNEL